MRGPGDLLYIIDHHHLSLALWQTQVDHAYVEIVDDLSRLSCERFWARMEDDGRLHPFDETGRRIDPCTAAFAASRASRHDPYRDLAWSVRECGGFEKDQVPYSEFFWASFFRSRIAPSALRSDYDWAVARAIKLARNAQAASLPGYRGSDEIDSAAAIVLPHRASRADGRMGAWMLCRHARPEPRQPLARASAGPRACRRSSSLCRYRACC